MLVIHFVCKLLQIFCSLKKSDLLKLSVHNFLPIVNHTRSHLRTRDWFDRFTFLPNEFAKEKIMLTYKYVTCMSNASIPNASEITDL